MEVEMRAGGFGKTKGKPDWRAVSRGVAEFKVAGVLSQGKARSQC